MAEQMEVIILDEDDNPNNKDHFVGEAAIDKEGLAKAMILSNQGTTVNFVFSKEILSEEIVLNSLKLRELGDRPIQIPVSLSVIFYLRIYPNFLLSLTFCSCFVMTGCDETKGDLPPSTLWERKQQLCGSLN